MNILNFNQNNYLTGNDLWVTINGFTNPVKNLKLKVKNLVNSKQYDLVLYPRIDKEFKINMTTVVRSLFDAPKHDSLPLNTLAKFEIKFDVSFVGAFPNEIENIEKYFIRGHTQNKVANTYINLNANLLIGVAKFYTNGITNFNKSNLLEFNIQREQNAIVEKSNFTQPISDCNYKIIKFLNSIGGYQYFLFEDFEIKESAKPLKNVPKITNDFNDTAFQSLGTELKKEIELITENSAEDQIIITEIVNSFDVLMWDSTAQIWIKLVPNANVTTTNTWDNRYKNKIKFDFYNEVNNTLIW